MEGREEPVATWCTKYCQWVDEYQRCDKPSFTASCGKQRLGPSITVKKNKDKIVLHVLPSVQSPSSTYEGPARAQRTGSLQGITREGGTQARGAERNEARTEA